MLLLGLCAVPLHADELDLRTQSMKCAFIVNFLNFIEWQPAPAQGLAKIALVGPDEAVDPVFAILQAQSAFGSEFTLSRAPNLGEVGTANLVYCLEVDPAEASSELVRLREQGTITVSGEEGFIEHGGTIQFVKLQDGLRFRIDADTSQTRAGFQISSKLLKLAVE